MTPTFDEVVERFLRPRALQECLDSSTWSDETHVWMRTDGVASDASVFVPGCVVSRADGKISVRLHHGATVTADAKDVFPTNAARYDRYEDMAQMGELNEACVLDNLKQRYASNLIYSFSGLFLVAVNPYRSIPIYEDDVVRWYRGQRRQDRPPHIFSVADGAYQALLSTRRSQSILITGESGAGKTENTKRVIHYLTAITGRGQQQSTLERQLLLTNPILESFGNAQTVRNNNSSRFGKFIRIDFDPAGGCIVGASIEKYLLEKSRVTHRAPAERSFHVFYQLLAGASDALLAQLRLVQRDTGARLVARDFSYLAQSRLAIDGVDDAADFVALQESLAVVGIGGDASVGLFRVLAAILLLGNLRVEEDGEGQAQLSVTEHALLEDICVLLGVEEDVLRAALLNPVIRAGREIVVQARGREQVLRSVEALSRALYDRLFSSLVDRLNAVLFAAESETGRDVRDARDGGCNSNSGHTPHTAHNAHPFIGVLDIAGFEIFERNSFEQLLINYTNEKLQQFFNHHMFVVEQQEYARQGIAWDFVDFGLDSQPMIDVLERTSPVGILACLDEDCVLPRATDRSFTAKVQQLCQAQGTGRFEVDRLQAERGFILHHYAGRVEYRTEGWLDKNKDPLNENVTRLLAHSRDSLVAALFVDYVGSDDDIHQQQASRKQRSGAFRTVAQKHRESLALLMQQLASTQPHFVRCIVPNGNKQPGLFHDRLVLEQLQCNGVLEGIRICRQGFPNRLSYADFWRLYSILLPGWDAAGGKESRPPGQHEVASFLAETMGWHAETDYALGRDKVFFRAGRLGRLDGHRDGRLAEALRELQAACRGALVRAALVREHTRIIATQTLQDALRPFLALRRNPWMRLLLRVKPLLTVTRAETRIRELETRISGLEAEREEARMQVTAAGEEQQRLHVAMEEQTTRIHVLEERVAEQHARSETLLLALAEETNKMHASEAALEASSVRTRELSQLVAEEQMRNETLARQLRDETTRIAVLEQTHSESKDRVLVLEQEIAQERVQAETLQLEVAEGRRQMAALERELAVGRAAIETLEESVAQERSKGASLERELVAERSKTATLETALVEQKTIAETLSIRLREEQTGLAAAQEELVRLRTHAEQLTGRLRDTETERDETRVSLVRCREEVARAESRARETAQLLADTEERVSGGEATRRRLEMDIDALEERLHQLSLEREAARKASTQQAEEHAKGADAEAALLIQQEKLRGAEAARLLLSEQLETMRTSNVHLVKERNQLQGRLERLAEERDQLRDQLRTAEANRPHTEGVVSAPELAQILARLDADCLERQSLLGDNRRLERELRDVRDALADREHALLQAGENVQRGEQRVRKLQGVVADLEGALAEAEQQRRRLAHEFAEERVQTERLRGDLAGERQLAQMTM